MDKTFLEHQKNLASQHLEKLVGTEGKEKEAVSIVSEYLSSLLHSENFTEAQKEDLRKLALELEFQESTSFEEWIKTLGEKMKAQ